MMFSRQKSNPNADKSKGTSNDKSTNSSFSTFPDDNTDKTTGQGCPSEDGEHPCENARSVAFANKIQSILTNNKAVWPNIMRASFGIIRLLVRFPIVSKN